MQTHTHARTHIRTHTPTHTHPHTNTHTHKHTQVHEHTHTPAHLKRTRMHAHRHVYRRNAIYSTSCDVGISFSSNINSAFIYVNTTPLVELINMSNRSINKLNEIRLTSIFLLDLPLLQPDDQPIFQTNPQSVHRKRFQLL